MNAQNTVTACGNSAVGGATGFECGDSVLLPPAFLVPPDRTADRDFPYIQTQRELWQETEVILHKIV
jgi:hypothetical protein